MIDNLIMVVFGIQATLVGYGKIPVSKDASKNQEYLKKYGNLIRVCGIALIGIGVLLAISKPFVQ